MTDIQGIAVLLGSLLVSITCHEAMHAYVANWLGDDTAKHQGRISLNPVNHIDPVTTVILPLFLYLSHMTPFGAAKPVPINTNRLKGQEFGAALVGAAGPLTNFALAAVSSLVLRLGLVDGSRFMFEALLLFTELNIGLGVFNLIPYPPLDGSRVLYAFAPRPLQDIMERIEGLGFVGILFFMFFIVRFIGPVMGTVVDIFTRFALGI